MVMWVPLKLSEKTLLYKCIEQHQELCFTVTDLKRTWEKSLSREEFVRFIINDNQFLEGSLNETISKMALKKMAQETEGWIKSVHWNIDNDKAHLSYTFKKSKDPITLKINLTLDVTNAEKFFERVTLPFLRTINEMKKANCELKSIIKIKDEEIEKYKSKGAILNIEYLITDKFDPIKFNNKYQTYDKDIKSMEEILPMEIANAHKNIKKKPTEDLEEPGQKPDKQTKVEIETLKMELNIENIIDSETNKMQNGECSKSVTVQDNSTLNEEIKLNEAESNKSIRKKRKVRKMNF